MDGLRIVRSPGSLLVAVLLSACNPGISHAANTQLDPSLQRTEVSEVVVRYTDEAPAMTRNGRPWGSQCVSRAFRDRLVLGRDIGGGMRVVRLDPPVSANVGTGIASQIERCPHIEWAEADRVQFSVL